MNQINPKIQKPKGAQRFRGSEVQLSRIPERGSRNADPASRIPHPGTRIPERASLIPHPSLLLLLYCFFLILLFAISCTPQQRLNRLVTRHNLTITDTILHTGTVITTPSEADTLLRLPSLPSSTHIHRDRLHMILTRQVDTLRLQGRCDPETIVTTTRIPVKKIRYLPLTTPTHPPAKLPWIIATISLILLTLIRRR